MTVLALSVGSCIVPLALVPVPGVSPFARCLVMMLGPAAGWMEAVASHQVAQGLGLLLGAALWCAIPLGIYVATRHPGWLCVAGVAWVATGWILGVAVLV